MCATATATRNWKRLFSALELFVIFAILYGIALSITWHYDTGGHPFIMTLYQSLMALLLPMLWTFMIVMPFLLVVSPFFLRSLRSSALKAWLVGVIGLLYLLGINCGWWLR
jgi:hypothetical protein